MGVHHDWGRSSLRRWAISSALAVTHKRKVETTRGSHLRSAHSTTLTMSLKHTHTHTHTHHLFSLVWLHFILHLFITQIYYVHVNMTSRIVITKTSNMSCSADTMEGKSLHNFTAATSEFKHYMFLTRIKSRHFWNTFVAHKFSLLNEINFENTFDWLKIVKGLSSKKSTALKW